MTKETPKTAVKSPLQQLLNFLSSMQLGIILLLLLAVISVFATLKENETAITSIYHSWWYLGMMAFTALNLLLCTARRIKPVTKLAFHPHKLTSPAALRQMPHHYELKMEKVTAEAALAQAEAAFKKNGLQVEVTAGQQGRVLFAERGKIGYFGSLVTHLSLLVILLGAMYGSLTGFEARNGGLAGDHFHVEQGDFRVDIKDVKMEQEADPTVRPRVFSELVITRDDQPLSEGTVAINQPLRFNGNTIYHTTFRYVSDVVATDLATGKEQQLKLWDIDQLQLDEEGKVILHVMQFFPNFSMHGGGVPYSKNYLPENPVLAGLLIENNKAVRNVFLILNEPEVIKTSTGEIELLMTGFENAAVFTITRNLGRPILFTGAVLLILGLYLSFFTFPRRFWAVFAQESNSLIIGGRSRNRLLLEQELEQINQEISKGGEARV
ncbi:MAG TPA: cytochrome c biogenesis protein ResB [Oscillospiraceae bacterium]|nr:cytochrome c biogenesis protein ResB [Oscillospiraceae bacterium]